MKYLLVASFAESLVNFRGDLINDLISLGIEVHVIAPAASSEVFENLSQRGVVCHEVPLNRTGMNPVKDIFSFFSLWRLMSSIKPDIVMAYTIKPVIYGGLAAVIAGVPNRYAMITGLGYAFQGSGKLGILRRLVRILYRCSLRFTDKVFFQNPDDLQLFLDYRILDRSHSSIVVNGSGVNTDQFSVAPLPDKPVFLLIARLLGDKGIREYVNAARIVKQIYPSVSFELVGWIDENPDSISKIELDGWVGEGIVDFRGKLKDVRPAIANCSVYVLPSYREGTPRTVLEAMAMGRAVITTDAPGCKETVEPGKNGFLVPVKSVNVLADRMISMIENPDLIRDFGRKSREVVEEKYDVRKVNEHMLNEMGIFK